MTNRPPLRAGQLETSRSHRQGIADGILSKLRDFGKDLIVASTDDAVRQPKILHPPVANSKIAHIPVEHDQCRWCVFYEKAQAFFTGPQILQHGLGFVLPPPRPQS